VTDMVGDDDQQDAVAAADQGRFRSTDPDGRPCLCPTPLQQLDWTEVRRAGPAELRLRHGLALRP